MCSTVGQVFINNRRRGPRHRHKATAQRAQVQAGFVAWSLPPLDTRWSEGSAAPMRRQRDYSRCPLSAKSGHSCSGFRAKVSLRYGIDPASARTDTASATLPLAQREEATLREQVSGSTTNRQGG